MWCQTPILLISTPTYQRYFNIKGDNIEFSGAINYLKVVKYSLSNVIIKVLHLIPWSISNANQYNRERIVTDNQNIPHLGQIHKQEKVTKEVALPCTNDGTNGCLFLWTKPSMWCIWISGNLKKKRTF